LLADNRADDGTQKLQAELLGVEVELLTEQLGDFDCDHDTCEEKHDRVRKSRDNDADLAEEAERSDELVGCDLTGVDAAEQEQTVGLCGFVATAHVPALVAQAEVQDKLHRVGNGERPVDPAVCDAEGEKAEEERSYWHADGDHQCPDAHVAGSICFEEHLFHDAAADCGGRADEEGCDGAADGHAGV